MSTTPTNEIRNGSQRRLSEAEKQSIVAAVATGKSQTQVAIEFGVHRNTVWALCQPVKEIANSPLNPGWRSKLNETLPQLSVDAIERSVKDTDDVHKAAGTAIQHLKGIGVLASENSSQVNVFVQQIQGLPADWQASYFGMDDTPSPVVDSGQSIENTGQE